MDRVVHANGVELCVDTFGQSTDPAILLIAGGASSMDWWEDEFCERLAAGLRFVIRYDHRDTGRSTSYEPGAAPYALPDLAADAVGLLDTLGVKCAHIVGMSMGGTIALHLAVDYSQRVDSLTLISTSPGRRGGPSRPDLPPMSEALKEHFAQDSPPPDWNDRAAVIDYLVEGQRPFAGSWGFDAAHAREIAGRVFDRTTNMAACVTNHGSIAGGDPIRPRLGQVSAPTLVIHGSEDPLFPFAHAQALANEIPGARLLPLERVGHEMPPAATWDVIIPAILLHTSGGWDEQGDRVEGGG
jgi:pimeloyl-ACP methyl ester carboxylesterase